MRFVTLPVLLLLATPFSSAAATEPACAAAARDRAKQLLTFHAGPDDRLAIDKTAKHLAPLRNPADPKQLFDVLEIWGYIYKGKYRMRFIYYKSPEISCMLMGEEILEYARP